MLPNNRTLFDKTPFSTRINGNLSLIRHDDIYIFIPRCRKTWTTTIWYPSFDKNVHDHLNVFGLQLLFQVDIQCRWRADRRTKRGNTLNVFSLNNSSISFELYKILVIFHTEWGHSDFSYRFTDSYFFPGIKVIYVV